MDSNKKRKLWCPEAMKKAYLAVKNKEMGYLKAAKTFSVPKSTIEDYIKSKKNIDELLQSRLGRPPTFNPEIEAELVNYSLQMVNKYYGLRASDLKYMAFQLAVKNNLPNQFSDKGAAGKKWLSAFLKRHPELTFRTPEATTALRARGFSKDKVDFFFDNILQAEMAKVNFDPTRVFNVDETGVTVVQSKMARVICRKGQKQVGGITSAERGSLVTLVFCMSAAGLYVPPMFVFPRVHMKRELEDGAPPGSIFAAHKSGWIQMDLFTKWFQHFIKYVKPSKESPVLLLLDGHFSHTRNLDLIQLARENGVILVSIPPHSSHKLQPLDVGFMSPFKIYYSQEIETWLRSHPGRIVTAYQISELVGKAYLRAASTEIAVNAFQKSGICPFNKNVFRDQDFAVDCQESDSVTFEETKNAISDSVVSDSGILAINRSLTYLPSTSMDDVPNETSTINTYWTPLPSTSRDEVSCETSTINRPLTPLTPSTSRDDAPCETSTPRKNVHHSSKLLVSPEMIRPVPSINKISGKQSSRQKKPAVLTASPYKNELQKVTTRKRNESLTKKKTAISEKQTKSKGVKKIKSHKRQISYDSETDESDIEMILESDEDCENDNDVQCVFCDGAYSNDKCGEKWIRCIACYKWCHELCAGVEDSNIIDFICDICKQG